MNLAIINYSLNLNHSFDPSLEGLSYKFIIFEPFSYRTISISSPLPLRNTQKHISFNGIAGSICNIAAIFGLYFFETFNNFLLVLKLRVIMSSLWNFKC